MNLAVDVISDVICPWCYIGKRRLEKATAAVGRASFGIVPTFVLDEWGIGFGAGAAVVNEQAE